jgi:hypothetical protein
MELQLMSELIGLVPDVSVLFGEVGHPFPEGKWPPISNGFCVALATSVFQKLACAVWMVEVGTLSP